MASLASKNDNELLSELFNLMARERSDYTRTFRMLSQTEQHSAQSPLRDEFIDRAAFDDWFTRYRSRLQQDNIADADRQTQMKAANPAMVLRNWLAQRVINQAEQGITPSCIGYTRRCVPHLSIVMMTMSAVHLTGVNGWK